MIVLCSSERMNNKSNIDYLGNYETTSVSLQEWRENEYVVSVRCNRPNPGYGVSHAFSNFQAARACYLNVVAALSMRDPDHDRIKLEIMHTEFETEFDLLYHEED